jgi:branched-chain amino acid transport system permease protein
MLHAKNTQVLLALALALVGYAIIALPPYFVFLATTGVLIAIMVRSLGVLTDQAGLLSLCHMTFAGIGAWAVGWLGIHAPQLPYLLMLALGGVAGLVAGVLIGLPALRLRGLNLAAITLTFAVAADAVFSTIGFPGNEAMIAFQRPGLFADERNFLALCVVLFIVITVVLRRVSQARTGAMWEAISYSERATAAMGVSVARAKLTAFSASAGLAGLCGGLMMSQLGVLTASNFSPLSSLSLFALTIFVGGRYWEGTLIAGLLFVGVPELLRRFGLPLDLEAVIFAVGAIDALRKKSSLAGGIRLALKARQRRKSGEQDHEVTERETEEICETSSKRFVQDSDSTLEISNLLVHYGNVVAVDNLSITVEPGTIMGLVGPNGAGKSTIIDAVTGFLPDAGGIVRLGDTDLHGSVPHHRAELGVRRTFQQGRSIPELTVGQYLRLSAGHDIPDEDIDAILTYMECPTADTLISDIEIGLRRVVEIAANLAARPQVLLLDEPAAGLSADQSEKLGQHIARIPELFGCSVLLVEHDMDLVRTVCDQITVVDFGKVIAQGTPDQVLNQSNVLEAYLGAA